MIKANDMPAAINGEVKKTSRQVRTQEQQRICWRVKKAINTEILGGYDMNRVTEGKLLSKTPVPRQYDCGGCICAREITVRLQTALVRLRTAGLIDLVH
jgi:hypothetical protein